MELDVHNFNVTPYRISCINSSRTGIYVVLRVCKFEKLSCHNTTFDNNSTILWSKAGNSKRGKNNMFRDWPIETKQEKQIQSDVNARRENIFLKQNVTFIVMQTSLFPICCSRFPSSFVSVLFSLFFLFCLFGFNLMAIWIYIFNVSVVLQWAPHNVDC